MNNNYIIILSTILFLTHRYNGTFATLYTDIIHLYQYCKPNTYTRVHLPHKLQRKSELFHKHQVQTEHINYLNNLW